MKRLVHVRRAGVLAGMLTATLIVGHAAAADPPGQPAPAKNAPAKSAAKAKNVMTRDELRVCLNEQDRMKQLRAGITRDEAELDRQKAEVQRIDAEIAGKRGTIDPADAAAVAAVKDQLAKRDALVDAYNASLSRLRERAAAHETSRTVWLERCGNRNFDEMDEAAIRLEQKRAAGATKKN